jgi:hypothetical protein
VRAYSGKRFEPGSDHNCGAAVDFVGSDTAQRRLYDYGKTVSSWWVEPWATSHTIGAAGTTGPHVHISFFRCGSVPKNNPKPGGLTFTDYRDAWLRAGGMRSFADIMAAVGYAESKGDPRAHCLNCAGVREDSRGAWQINVYAHPQYSNWNLYNLDTNATAAVQVFQSSGPRAWSTFQNGTYVQYLPKGNSHIPHLPGKSIPGIITGIPGDIAGIPGDIVGSITNPIEKGLVYVGKDIFYGVIIMAGVAVGVIGAVMVGVDITIIRHRAAINTMQNLTPGAIRQRREVKAEATAERETRITVRGHREVTAQHQAGAAKARADIQRARATRERRKTRAGSPAAKAARLAAQRKSEKQRGVDVFGAPLE